MSGMTSVVRVKHCGITSLEDAELCVPGAWALGMVFFKGSKRLCKLGEAERIGAAMHRRVELVGVFVNAPIDHVVDVADRAKLTMIQLHGDEGPAYASEIERRTGAKIIKAGRVATEGDVRAVDTFRRADFHLLDTRVDGEFGGTGETFEWSMSREHRSEIPLILSGGLTPENVGDAIRAVRPYAVDVASGTESAPGVKEPMKVLAFNAAVASAADAEDPVALPLSQELSS